MLLNQNSRLGRKNLNMESCRCKPILCYASHIWGYEYSERLESIKTENCQKFLGVNDLVNNCMVLGECGRMPLYVMYYSNLRKLLAPTFTYDLKTIS